MMDIYLFFFFRSEGTGQRDGFEGMWGGQQWELKKRSRRENERLLSRMKEMETKEARDGKENEDEASNCSRDWLQLMVMIAAGRGGVLSMEERLWEWRTGETEVHHAWGRLKRTQMHTHTHTHNHNHNRKSTVPSVIILQGRGTDAVLLHAVCVLICVPLIRVESNVTYKCLLVIKWYFGAHIPK